MDLSQCLELPWKCGLSDHLDTYPAQRFLGVFELVSKSLWGVPAVMQGDWQCLWSTGMQGPSLTQHSGLRICRSLDLIPGLEIHMLLGWHTHTHTKEEVCEHSEIVFKIVCVCACVCTLACTFFSDKGCQLPWDYQMDLWPKRASYTIDLT